MASAAHGDRLPDGQEIQRPFVAARLADSRLSRPDRRVTDGGRVTRDCFEPRWDAERGEIVASERVTDSYFNCASLSVTDSYLNRASLSVEKPIGRVKRRCAIATGCCAR